MAPREDLTTNGKAGRVHSVGAGEGVSDPNNTGISRDELEAVLADRKAIPRNIVHDSSLSVRLGGPEEGSFCQYGGPSGLRVDRVTRSITIDPIHLLDEGSKFIIAHEGMHAYVTRSAFDTAVLTHLKKACDPEALYKEVGFASLLNYLEDCGGNNWLTKHYPAFKEAAQKLYDKMLHSENPEMHSGETQAVTARLGFYPRFAQFGSEIMKRWHTGSYSTNLDPAVEKALKQQQGNADKFISEFPATQVSTDQQRDIHFCRRFLIAANGIMPALRTLIDLDKAQAALQQFANQQQAQGGQQQQQGGQQQGGQQGSQQQGAGNSPGLDGAVSGGGAGLEMSPQTRAEIDQKTAAHRQKLRDQLNKQLDELEQHLGLKGSDATGASGAPSKDPSQRIKDLEKAIEDRFGDQGDKGAKADIEKYLDSLRKLNESIDSQAAPIDELSPQAQEELQKLYDKLSRAEQRNFEEMANDLLKEFEDSIREALESKTQEQPAPSHGQQKQARQDAEHAEKIRKQIDEDKKRDEAERQSRLSLWDQAREAVGPLINKLYSRLEQILRPAVPEWEAGHATGNKINPPTAMQAKADPNLKTKMWEQRSLPVERNFVFSLLVDNSGSMSMGDSQKYLHARQCAVLQSQVLTRLNIPFQISIFANHCEVLKDFDEKTTKEQKNQIGAAINGQGGGTEDFSAIKRCVADLKSRGEEHRFLIVLTDGGSNNPTELVNVLQEALKNNIIVIGLGLGDETRDVDRYYPLGRGGLTLDEKNKDTALGPYFAGLLQDILTNPQQIVQKALNKQNEQ